MCIPVYILTHYMYSVGVLSVLFRTHIMQILNLIACFCVGARMIISRVPCPHMTHLLILMVCSSLAARLMTGSSLSCTHMTQTLNLMIHLMLCLCSNWWLNVRSSLLEIDSHSDWHFYLYRQLGPSHQTMSMDSRTKRKQQSRSRCPRLLDGSSICRVVWNRQILEAGFSD